MKKADVALDKVYAVKVSGKVAPVRLVSVHSRGGWMGVNERTGRAVRIRSAQRLRFEIVEPDAQPVREER